MLIFSYFKVFLKYFLLPYMSKTVICHTHTKKNIFATFYKNILVKIPCYKRWSAMQAI